MNKSLCRAILQLSLTLVLPSGGWAAVTGIPNSNVDAYFGSQSDAYQDSNPLGAAPWPASPILLSPPPPSTYFLAAIPGSPPNPNTTPSNVTTFAPALSTSGFNDGFGNQALSRILGFAGSTGTMDDAQIGMNMFLTQGSTGYAYEQLNYSIDYALANTPNAAGFLSGLLTSAVTRSFAITGSVGSWVYFGGQMDFWDVPTVGPATPMGTLTFNFSSNVAGPFAAIVSNTATIGPGNVPWGIDAPDTLRITGTFLLAGDPCHITVQTVPIPAAAWLFGGALGLLGAARRRSAA